MKKMIYLGNAGEEGGRLLLACSSRPADPHHQPECFNFTHTLFSVRMVVCLFVFSSFLLLFFFFFFFFF